MKCGAGLAAIIFTNDPNRGSCCKAKKLSHRRSGHGAKIKKVSATTHCATKTQMIMLSVCDPRRSPPEARVAFLLPRGNTGAFHKASASLFHQDALPKRNVLTSGVFEFGGSGSLWDWPDQRGRRNKVRSWLSAIQRWDFQGCSAGGSCCRSSGSWLHCGVAFSGSGKRRVRHLFIKYACNRLHGGGSNDTINIE